MKVLTDSNKMLILRLRCQGKTFRQIETMTGISKSVAGQYCKGLYFFAPGKGNLNERGF